MGHLGRTTCLVHSYVFQNSQEGIECTKAKEYSSVPNRRVGRNKRAGGKILKKTLNVQDIIDVQGGKFSEKINKCADQNKAVQGGIFSCFHQKICQITS